LPRRSAKIFRNERLRHSASIFRDHNAQRQYLWPQAARRAQKGGMISSQVQGRRRAAASFGKQTLHEPHRSRRRNKLPARRKRPLPIRCRIRMCAPRPGPCAMRRYVRLCWNCSSMAIRQTFSTTNDPVGATGNSLWAHHGIFYDADSCITPDLASSRRRTELALRPLQFNGYPCGALRHPRRHHC